MEQSLLNAMLRAFEDFHDTDVESLQYYTNSHVVMNCNQGIALNELSSEDLEIEITLSIQELQRSNDDNSRTLIIVSQITKYERTGLLEHLENAIAFTYTGLSNSAASSLPHYKRRLKDLLALMLKKYNHSKAEKDLDEMADTATRLVRASQLGDTGFQYLLRLLEAMQLSTSGHSSKRIYDLMGVETKENVANIMEGGFDKTWDGFHNTGRSTLLEDCIRLGTEAVDSTSVDHARYGWRKTRLACAFALRYQRTNNYDDLEKAIHHDEEALHLQPQGPATSNILRNLASSLGLKLKSNFSLETLNRVIDISRRAVAETSPENRGSRLTNLAIFLATRARETLSRDDLKEAIALDEEAVECGDRDPAMRRTILSNQLTNYMIQIEITEDVSDISKILEKYKALVDDTPLHDRFRSLRLANMATLLHIRFYTLGDPGDLRVSINKFHEAVDCAYDAYNRCERLISLAGVLFERSGISQDMDLLSESIIKTREAIALVDANHVDWGTMCNSLGAAHLRRFRRSRISFDLDEAIKWSEKAVACKNRPQFRIRCLVNLAEALTQRFIGVGPGARYGNPKDIERAIQLCKEAAEMLDPNRPMALAQLCQCLWHSAVSRGDDNSLNQAVDAGEEALKELRKSNINRCGYMKLLAWCYSKRFETHKDAHDAERAVNLLTGCVEIPNAPPHERISAAKKAAELLLQFDPPRWSDISDITEAGVKLLRLLSARALRQNDQQYAVGQFSGLTTLAAAAALQTGKGPSYALELLELGRNIIIGLRLETQTDLTKLRKQDARLADRFEQLRDQLNADTSILAAVNSLGERAVTGRWSRHNLEHEFDEVTKDISRLPGFKTFFQPMKADEFIEAASSGPIAVINVTPFRCDAILVTSNGILEPLRLSDQLYSKLGDATKTPSSIHSSATLQLLWDTIALPVLDFLGFGQRTKSGEPCPRIWWITTGVLTLLPLHAAGYHRLGSSQTVLDRVVSSYAPSLKTLIHARRRVQSDSFNGASGTALLVSMSETPDISASGLHDLQYTEIEVGIVASLVPGDVEILHLPEPSKEEIMAEMNKCSIFHFAGHGSSHPWDPSRSCLLLTDWKEDPLTVSDFNNLKLYQKPPWLAYLSACSTGENQANHLFDETIHLVSICQLAGFQHVIGSLWTIDDEYSVDVAREVYSTMGRLGWSNDGVAQGIWNASKQLRDKISTKYRKTARTIKMDEDGLEVSEEESSSEGKREDRGAGKATWYDYEASVWAAYFHVGP